MLQKYSQRERIFLIGGGVVLFVIILSFGVVNPYRAMVSKLDKSIAASHKQLQQVKKYRIEYLDLKKKARLLQGTTGRGNKAPMTFLEETVVRLAGRGNLSLMRPLPTAVEGPVEITRIEFKVDRLTLGQAVRLVAAIENSRPQMRFDKLFLKQRFDSSSDLDMSATVSTVRRD